MTSRKGKHVLPFGEGEKWWLDSFTASPLMPPLEPGKLLRIARTRLRMTQGQLARRAGVDPAHVTRIENGKIDAQWSTYAKLFRALDCELIPIVKPKDSFTAIEEARIRAYAAQRFRTIHARYPDDPMTEEKARAWQEEYQTRLREHRTTEIWLEDPD